MFSGIDKAKVELKGNRIEVTIAGPNFEPLSEDAALSSNLSLAMNKLGDGDVEASVLCHRNMLLFIFAGVKIDDRYIWENEHSEIRRALFGQFGFHRALFDTNIHTSDVIATIQSVEGVVYVDLDAFAGILKTDVSPDAHTNKTPLSERANSVSEVEVSGDVLCFLTPDIPNTLRIERR